jgi:hypothetical protein
MRRTSRGSSGGPLLENEDIGVVFASAASSDDLPVRTEEENQLTLGGIHHGRFAGVLTRPLPLRNRARAPPLKPNAINSDFSPQQTPPFGGEAVHPTTRPRPPRGALKSAGDDPGAAAHAAYQCCAVQNLLARQPSPGEPGSRNQLDHIARQVLSLLEARQPSPEIAGRLNHSTSRREPPAIQLVPVPS